MDTSPQNSISMDKAAEMVAMLFLVQIEEKHKPKHRPSVNSQKSIEKNLLE